MIKNLATSYVTDKKIAIPTSLWKKIQICIYRCERETPKTDSLIIIEGDEGVGKTTFSAMIGYIVSYYTKRPFSEKNFFFDLGTLINFAKSTKKQIIILDESALELLSSEWWKKTQIDLIKTLMMARKRRHFLIFNLTKFYKFPEYIIVDRARCLIHIYTRGSYPEPRFIYIKRKYLEQLYNDYRFKKRRRYFFYASKSGKIRGTFPNVLDDSKEYNILDVFNLSSYETSKDKAIEKIGESNKKNSEDPENEKYKLIKYMMNLEILKLKKAIGDLTYPIETKGELCKKLGVDPSTVTRWRYLSYKKEEYLKEYIKQISNKLSINIDKNDGLLENVVPNIEDVVPNTENVVPNNIEKCSA